MKDAVATDRERIDLALAAPTLCAAFQTNLRLGVSGPALVTEDGSTISWHDYGAQVRRLAEGFHVLGVRSGDAVALLLPNVPEFHLVDTALLHLGAIPFSIYATEPAERMAMLAQGAGVRVVVAHHGRSALGHEVKARATTVERLVVVGAEAGEAGAVGLAEVAALRDADFDFDRAWQAVTPETIATLIHTSGTTGEPKAVRILHRAVMAGVAGVEEMAPTTPGQTTVSFLPAAHISDRFICYYSTLVLGGTITCVDDHENLWDQLAATRPTRFHGVPRTFEKLLQRAHAILDEDPALRSAFEQELTRVQATTDAGQPHVLPPPSTTSQTSTDPLYVVRRELGLDRVEWLSVAAAPSSRETLEAFLALGLPLAELWGMTEFIMATMNPPERIKVSTVGIPLRSVEARLAEDGELVLRGPHAFGGFHGSDEPPPAVDEWFPSGDLAQVDAEGYFSIVGRKKEQMINSSGKNLVPVKIEASIREQSRLLAHVVAIGDRRRFVTALIALDPDELVRHAGVHGIDGEPKPWSHPTVLDEVARAVEEGNRHLARVEQVRQWTVLPDTWSSGDDHVTPTMKLRRAAIHETYAVEIERMYE